jgi:hypothetical protein
LVVAVPVSPKVQLKVKGAVPLAVVAVNVTGRFASGEVGVKLKVTEKAPETMTDCVDVALTPFPSVAVTVTLNVPELV